MKARGMSTSGAICTGLSHTTLEDEGLIAGDDESASSMQESRGMPINTLSGDMMKLEKDY
jgi:hypothetical protein